MAVTVIAESFTSTAGTVTVESDDMHAVTSKEAKDLAMEKAAQSLPGARMSNTSNPYPVTADGEPVTELGQCATGAKYRCDYKFMVGL